MSVLGFFPFMALMIVVMLAIGNALKFFVGLYNWKFDVSSLLKVLVLTIIFAVGFHLMTHFAAELGIKVSNARA